MQNLTLDEKKKRLSQCESDMQSNYFGYRQFEERSVEIAVNRLYEALDFHSFESYYKAKWPEAEKASSRKYQLLKYAEVVGNIAQVMAPGIKTELYPDEQFALPAHEKQTRPLAKYEPEDQAALWQLSQEASGKAQPSGNEVAAVVKELQPTNERISRLDTDKNAKAPPVQQSQFARKSFRVSEFKFDTEAQKVHFQVFKPGNTFKGWEPRTERLSITLDDLVWELRNIGFCLVPVGDNMPAAAQDEPQEATGLVPDERLDLNDGVPRDAAGKPMSPKLIAYWQARGYFPEFNFDQDDTETESRLSEHSTDSHLLAERALAGRSAHAGVSGTRGRENGKDTFARESRESMLGAFFPIEDTPQ